jgi:hypothetical protein
VEDMAAAKNFLHEEGTSRSMTTESGIISEVCKAQRFQLLDQLFSSNLPSSVKDESLGRNWVEPRRVTTSFQGFGPYKKRRLARKLL